MSYSFLSCRATWLAFSSYYAETSRHLFGMLFKFTFNLQVYFSNLLERVNLIHHCGCIKFFSTCSCFGVTSSCCLFASLTRYGSTSEKGIEIFLKIWSVCWMSLEYNHTLSVDDHCAWYTWNIILITEVGFVTSSLISYITFCLAPYPPSLTVAVVPMNLAPIIFT